MHFFYRSQIHHHAPLFSIFATWSRREEAIVEKMSKEQGPKRRKTSKKNKASWRKNTDVKDVQDFLAERSREQVTG